MNFLGVPLLGDKGALSFPKDYTDCSFAKPVLEGFALSQTGDQKWFIIKIILASLIAATALIGNSKEGVIGSMLISPLGVPVIGLIGALFVGNQNDAIRSLGFVLLAFALMFGTGFAVGKFNKNFGTNKEITDRFNPPTRTTFFNAIVIGTVFAIGALTAHKNVGMGVAELIGAGIAISLLPPVVNAGLAFSNDNIPDKMTKVKNSMMISLYNVAGVVVATVLVFFTNCVWDWALKEEGTTMGVSKLGIQDMS